MGNFWNPLSLQDGSNEPWETLVIELFKFCVPRTFRRSKIFSEEGWGSSEYIRDCRTAVQSNDRLSKCKSLKIFSQRGIVIKIVPAFWDNKRVSLSHDRPNNCINHKILSLRHLHPIQNPLMFIWCSLKTINKNIWIFHSEGREVKIFFSL